MPLLLPPAVPFVLNLEGTHGHALPGFATSFSSPPPCLFSSDSLPSIFYRFPVPSSFLTSSDSVLSYFDPDGEAVIPSPTSVLLGNPSDPILTFTLLSPTELVLESSALDSYAQILSPTAVSLLFDTYPLPAPPADHSLCFSAYVHPDLRERLLILSYDSDE